MNLLLLALVPACFALNPVIGRALAEQFGPASLALVRWSLSCLLIGLIALAFGRAEVWRASPRHLLALGVLGALGMGFCAYAAYAGAHTAEATNISLIYACTAALVALWEVAAGRQRPSIALFLGTAACLFGVVLILTRGHPAVLRDLNFKPGDLWAAAGMLVFVLYTVALRRLPPRLTSLAQFAVMSLAATLVLLPFAAVEVTTAGLPPLHERTLPWIAAIVLATGVGAYLGYNISLKRNGPVLTSASVCLSPVFSAGQAVVLIGEQLAWYHGAALLLVVSGLLLVNRA